jgi:hypothetical protein
MAIMNAFDNCGPKPAHWRKFFAQFIAHIPIDKNAILMKKMFITQLGTSTKFVHCVFANFALCKTKPQLELCAPLPIASRIASQLTWKLKELILTAGGRNLLKISEPFPLIQAF